MSEDLERRAIRLFKEYESCNKKLHHITEILTKNSRTVNELKSPFFTEFIEQLERTKETKDEIVDFLTSHASLKINDRLARSQLKQIREGNTFIDRAYERLLDLAKTLDDYDENEYSEGFHVDYWFEALGTEGTAEYVDNSFHRRRKEVGALIVGANLPKTSIHHFKRLQETYALGLFDVTVILLRALIETAAFHYLKKRGMIKDLQSVSDMDSYRAREMIRKVRGKIKKHYDETIDIIDKAGAILHSKDEVVNTSEKYTLNAINTSINVIEILYN